MAKTDFTPDWYEQSPPPHSFRSLFKWGDPNEFKHPNHRLFELMKHTFHMQDADFKQRSSEGTEAVDIEIPTHLSSEHIHALQQIVGQENADISTYARIKASYGKGMIDVLRLRKGIIENLPDVVLSPRSKSEVQAIVTYCSDHRIPLYVYGAGSSVTRGMEAVRGGVCLDMSVHMKRVIRFSEIDQTIQVEAGMWGPILEETLQDAPRLFDAKHTFTCGHFPQSFEFSSIGGWVVTRGAGQNSTYFGKIEDIVIAQEYATPAGMLTTKPYPRKATGPDMDQVMLGSEGAFGILCNATLRIRRSLPQNRKYFSYMFKNWPDALSAVREIMQSESGSPSVFRLSDSEETDVAMRMYGVAGTPADSLLRALGHQPMQRCLLLGTVDGEKGFCHNLKRIIHRSAKRAGAFNLSPFGVAQRWEESRFRDPYMREDLHDFGILLDTLECAVTWSQLEKVHHTVREYVKNRPDTICMAHCSHFYPHGTNLYFIFIARMDTIDEYLQFQYGILEKIAQSGAAISHHHGIGKQTAPWFFEQAGEIYMGVLEALKDYFDPQHVMNPGGTLALDMSEEQEDKHWGINDYE
jgi:alkyldihydroxyacetonephosphate synthase